MRMKFQSRGGPRLFTKGLNRLWGRTIVVSGTFCALNLVTIALFGCQSVPGGQGATAGAAGHLWLAGNGVRDYPVPKTVAAKAVQEVMTQMGMTTVRASHSTVESSLEYKALDGNSVGIHLEEEHPPAPENGVRTVISIRVGAWGDEIKTDQIFLAISKALSLPLAPGAQAPGRLSPIAVSPTEGGTSGPVSNSIPGTVIYPSASPSGPFAGPPNPPPQITPQPAAQVMPQTYPQNYPPNGYGPGGGNGVPNYGAPPLAGPPVAYPPPNGNNGGTGPLVPIPNPNPYPPVNPYPPQ